MEFDQKQLPNIPADVAQDLRDYIEANYTYDGTTEMSKSIIQSITVRPKINNPNPPVKVPRPLSIMETISILSVDAVQTYKSLTVSDRDAVASRYREQDRDGVIMWALELFGMESQDYANVAQLITSTIDDPNHPEQVLGNSLLQSICGSKCTGMSIKELEYIMREEEPKLEIEGEI